MIFLSMYTAATEIYTLSLHDALPILELEAVALRVGEVERLADEVVGRAGERLRNALGQDRKSTRLNSSHVEISYAVFCLKKNNVSIGNIIYHDGAWGVSTNPAAIHES